MDAILYAGDSLGPLKIVQNLPATKSAGWTSVILSYLHVQKGELDFNHSTFIQNGNVVHPFSDWQKSLNDLKADGSIEKIYLSLGGSGVHDWKLIKSMCIPFKGYGGTDLEKNLTAIREKLPAIDGIEIDIQEVDAMSDYVYFTFFCEMLNKIGFEISFAAYGVPGSRPFEYYTTSFQQIRQVSWGSNAITRFNLRNYAGEGCVEANVWLDTLGSLVKGFNPTNFITIGSIARCTPDGGKTWRGSCPRDIKDFISQNAQQNPFCIGGGTIWNFDNIVQTTIDPTGCGGYATMALYAKCIAEGLEPAPRIHRINTIDDLRGWKFQLEDANVSRIPIAVRVKQSPDVMASLIGFDMGEFQYDPFFDAYSQGCCNEISTRTAANVYNFSYWQYADVVYYMGGNFVTIPPLVWTNCAHKNGVACLGAVNFDTLSLDEVQCLLTPKPPDAAPGIMYKEEFIALLTIVCKTFGFEGYLFNCEQYGRQLREDKLYVAGMLDILSAFNSPELKSIWYDCAMSADSKSGYDNMLTAGAYPYFQAASYFQTNYNWVSFNDVDNPQKSFETLMNKEPNKALANRKRVFQGLYCATKGNGESPPYGGKFFPSYEHIFSKSPSPPGCYTGLNVYYPDWVMYDFRKNPKGKNTDKLPEREEFHNNDEAFWNGSKTMINYPVNGQRNPVGPKQCMSYFLSRRTVITRMPFATWFNDGEGDFYNIEGDLRSQGSWNNLSDQNILPTYRFDVGEDSQKNNTRIDHGTTQTVFTGACSLYVDFGASLDVQFNLFDCEFALNSSQLFSLVVKAELEVVPFVLLYTSSPNAIKPTLDSSQDMGKGWVRYIYSVPAAQPNTTILRIAVSLTRKTKADPVCYIGEYSMLDQKDPPPEPRFKSFPNPKVDVLDFKEIYRADSHYRVYGLHGTTRNLIGIVYNSAYRIAYDGIPSKNVFNTNLTGFTSYLVQEVNAVGNHALKPAGG